jgi:hypothetical protein
MADTKISALPASTTPLAGTEVLPIVQSGVTKKTSIESVLTSVQPSGTANGVAYLNGSKVLTTGSALTFNGTNLGLGVTPSAWWSGSKAMQIGLGGYVQGRTGTASAVEIGANQFINSSIQRTYINSDYATYYEQSAGQHLWYNAASGTAGNAISFTQAMTLDASGNLLVGTTTNGGQGGLTVNPNGSAGSAFLIWNRADTASASTAASFRNNGTAVGRIEYTNTATSYVTSSDYRLKNTIAPMTGALAKVALLKPCTYKWNVDGSDGEGFIAHELAEVVPQCVTGEKDAVDAEGKPQYQGIDTSFLVATLTAAIQELKAEFDAYKASHP